MTNTFTKKSLVRSILCVLMLVVLVAGSMVGCASTDAKNAAEANSAKLAELETLIKDIQTATSNIYTHGANKTDIADLQELIDAANDSIEGLTTSVDNVKEDVAALAGDIDALNALIVANNEAINKLLVAIQDAVDAVAGDMIGKGDWNEVTAKLPEILAYIDDVKAKAIAEAEQYSPEDLNKIILLCENTKLIMLRATSLEHLDEMLDSFEEALDEIPTYVEKLQIALELVGTPVSISKEKEILAMEAAYNTIVDKGLVDSIPAETVTAYNAIMDRYAVLVAAREDANIFVTQVAIQYGGEKAENIKSFAELQVLREYIDKAYVKFDIPTDPTHAEYDKPNHDIYAEAEKVYAELVDIFTKKMEAAVAKYNEMLAAVEAAGDTIDFTDTANVQKAVALKAELEAAGITADVILPDGKTVVGDGYTAVTNLSKKFDDFCYNAAADTIIIFAMMNPAPDYKDIRNLEDIKGIKADVDAWIAEYMVEGVTFETLAAIKAYTFLTQADVDAVNTLHDNAVAHDAKAQEVAAQLIADMKAKIDAWKACPAKDILDFDMDYDNITDRVNGYIDEFYGASATLADSIYGVKAQDKEYQVAYAQYSDAVKAYKDDFKVVEDAIAQIPASLKLSSKDAIEAARKAYDEWATKHSVVDFVPGFATTAHEKLVAAETDYAALVAKYEADVLALETATNNLPATLVLADADKVADVVAMREALLAVEAYELTASPANNAAKLVAAEEAIQALKDLVNKIHSAIDALPEAAEGLDILAHKDAIEAVYADIATYVEKNLGTDGLDATKLAKLDALNEMLALADVIARKNANLDALKAYYEAAVADAKVDFANDAETLEAVLAKLETAYNRGVACIKDDRINTVKLADAALEVAKGLIDDAHDQNA